eukprot:1529182-Rhodomonas_salina.2
MPKLRSNPQEHVLCPLAARTCHIPFNECFAFGCKRDEELGSRLMKGHDPSCYPLVLDRHFT